MKPLLFPLLFLITSLNAWGERWKVQFFHDEDKSAITIQDIAFANEQVGIACGVFATERSRRGIVLLTRDGGKAWQRVDLTETPISLHFVNESLGFMVTEDGLWKTEERGLTWKKLKSWNNVSRVHFLDAENGFAFGSNRTFLATKDGGRTWTAVPEAKKLSANTNFYWLGFHDGIRGILLGSSSVPRRRRMSELPEYLDPEAAAKQREWPHLSATLETGDKGATWNTQTAPVFGSMRRLRFVPQGIYGLAILRYEHAFEVPSEAYLFNWKTGKSESVYRAPEKYIEDVAFLSPTTSLLAIIERPGKLMQSPLPGKLKILRSDNLRSYYDVPVDYRASGNRAMFAVLDAKNAWVALDSGMILKLEP